MCVLNGANFCPGLSLAPLGPLPCCLPGCHHEHCDAGVLIWRRLQHRKGEEVRRQHRNPGRLPSMQSTSTAGGRQYHMRLETNRPVAIGQHGLYCQQVAAWIPFKGRLPHMPQRREGMTGRHLNAGSRSPGSQGMGADLCSEVLLHHVCQILLGHIRWKLWQLVVMPVSLEGCGVQLVEVDALHAGR